MRESTSSGDTKVLNYPTAHHRNTPRYPHQLQHYRNTANNPDDNNIVSLPSMNIKIPEDFLPRPSSCISTSTSSTSSSNSSSNSSNTNSNHIYPISRPHNNSLPLSSSSSTTTPSFQAQWLFFSNSRWIPLDIQSHSKLERTLQLGGVFVDIQDSHFPDVPRIRVFPGADYLSYLGIRYRISRVLLPAL
ncbi:hypothetical protein INT45_006685 [Circinella minor]|uniref:WWE domain-containing protein n=1 Tax=Circinella minor TaxID=1195481 RepID=A0A8H7S4F6_9FUNG|nr:hypothetical protein INT45_006685 [Circinella minor]